MNLLVTGGAGFIGSTVIPLFLRQDRVARLVNLDCLTYAGHLANLEAVSHHPKYSFEKVDLRQPAAVFEVLRRHDITHVLHLAAESHVDRSIGAPADFIQTNILGTFHLLEACRRAWEGRFPERRFHQVSTDEVYGTLGPEGAFREGDPYAPNSPYSASKAAADLLVRSYHRTYGFPAVISNCSNNYGPYQFPEKLIPVAIQAVLDRRPVPLYGDGLNVRDWLHVADHAEALWLVLTRGRPGETYHVGAQNEWTNLRIVELICDLVDEAAPHLGGSSRRLIRFIPDRPGHDRRYAIDASKIHDELGWKPTRPFERGLRETVHWYLAHQPWVAAVTSLSASPRATAQTPGTWH